jgi:hypothetical protein
MADFMQDQILQAFKQTLIQAATAAGTRVRIEGVDMRSTSATPGIDIEAGDEEVAAVSMGAGQTGARTLMREFRVEVHGVIATASDDYRTQASSLHQQIERALLSASPTFLDAVLRERPRLMGIRPDKDGEGSKVVYVMRSMWLCKYSAKEGA